MLETIVLIIYMLVVLTMWVLALAWCTFCIVSKIKKWRM